MSYLSSILRGQRLDATHSYGLEFLTDCILFQARLLNGIDLHSVSWHNHRQILAFVSAPHQVTICDYNDPGKYHEIT